MKELGNILMKKNQQMVPYKVYARSTLSISFSCRMRSAEVKLGSSCGVASSPILIGLGVYEERSRELRPYESILPDFQASRVEREIKIAMDIGELAYWLESRA